jgi:hypothetical protein
MNLDIQQLKITLSTNIPEIQSVELTSSLLYHPDYKSIKASNKYPYITSSREYPATALNGMEYDKIVDFFFNKRTFTKILTSSKYPPTVQMPSTDANQIYKRNIMTMLELLFSTKHFVVNNIHQSLDLVLNQSPSKSIFYNPMNTQFSYLKINNKPYTLTKIVWLNDIVNHPKYHELIKEVHNVKRSLDNDKNEALKGIQFQLAKTNVDPSLNNDELTYFKQSVQPNFSTSIRKSQNYFTPSFRKSSNATLQQYIDGNDVESTQNLFKSFEDIFSKFIMNNAGMKVNDDLLDVGVDKINFYMKDKREKNYPENEIFVLLNLIDGEVNESNKKEVYCPYTDQYLGNMLDNLLHTSNNDNKYIIEADELVYSIKPEYTAKNIVDNKNQNVKENINVNKAEVKALNPKADNVNDIFFATIFNMNDKNLDPILAEINNVSNKQLNQGNILNFIKESYKDSFNSNPNYNLNNLILKWNDDMNYNNNKLSKGLDEEFKKMQNSLTFDMSEINRILKEENSTDIEKILILKNRLSIIKLYLYIIDKLIGKTGNQPVTTGGGRKPNAIYKRRNKTIKKRRPNRKRTYKK